MDELYDILIEANPQMLEGIDKESFVDGFSGPQGSAALYDLVGEVNPDLIEGIDKETWVSTYGLTEPNLEDAPKEEKKEKNFLNLGFMNDTMVGDWFDDMARAMARGEDNGEAVGSALESMMRGADMTTEKMQSYIEAANNTQTLEQSAEFQEFMDDGGFATGKGWATFMNNAATVIPELIIESLSGMLLNKHTLTPILAGAGVTAASGGVGGLIAMPLAMGSASAMLETAGKFTEEIRAEIGRRGLEFDENGIRAVMEDEEAFKRIRRESLAKGLTIGAVDAITGGITGKVGAKAVSLGLKGAKKAKAVAKGVGIEATGGGLGEALGQQAAGEDFDITSIGLEAMSEIGSGAINVIAPYLKGEKKVDPATGEVLESAPPVDGEGTELNIEAPVQGEPLYSINGEEYTKEEFLQTIDLDPEMVLDENIQILVSNDEEVQTKLDNIYDDGQETTKTDIEQVTEQEGEPIDVEPDVEAAEAVVDDTFVEGTEPVVEKLSKSDGISTEKKSKKVKSITTDPVLGGIADKLQNEQELTEEEETIFEANTKKISNILDKRESEAAQAAAVEIEGEITQAEFDEFVDNGKASDEVLQKVANQIVTDKLTPEGEAIRQSFSKEIETKLSNQKTEDHAKRNERVEADSQERADDRSEKQRHRQIDTAQPSRQAPSERVVPERDVEIRSAKRGTRQFDVDDKSYTVRNKGKGKGWAIDGIKDETFTSLADVKDRLDTDDTLITNVKENATEVKAQEVTPAPKPAKKKTTKIPSLKKVAEKQKPTPKKVTPKADKPTPKVKPKVEKKPVTKKVVTKPLTKLEEIREQQAKEDAAKARRKVEKPVVEKKKKVAPKKVSEKGTVVHDTFKQKKDPFTGKGGFAFVVDGVNMRTERTKDGWELIGTDKTYGTIFELKDAIKHNTDGVTDTLHKNAKSINESRAKEKAEREAKAKEAAKTPLVAQAEADIDAVVDDELHKAAERAAEKAVKSEEGLLDVNDPDMLSNEEFLDAMEKDGFDLQKQRKGKSEGQATKAQLATLKSQIRKLKIFLKRISPNLSVEIYDSTLDLTIAIAEVEKKGSEVTVDELFKASQLAESGGLYHAESDTIFINAELFSDNVIFHEGGHVLMDFVFATAPELKNQFYNDLIELSAKYNVINEYLAFGDSYKNMSQEEAIIEFLSDVMTGRIDPNEFGSMTTLQRIRLSIVDMIHQLFKTFGITRRIVSADKSILNFAESIRQAYNDGQTLEVNPEWAGYQGNRMIEKAVADINEIDSKLGEAQVILEAIEITEGGTISHNQESLEVSVNRLNEEAGARSLDFHNGIKFATVNAATAKKAQRILNRKYHPAVKVKLLQGLGYSFQDAKDLVTGKTKIVKSKKKPKAGPSTKPKATPTTTTPHHGVHSNPSTWSKLTNKEKMEVNAWMERFNRKRDTGTSSKKTGPKALKKRGEERVKRAKKMLAAFKKFETMLKVILPNLSLNYHSNPNAYATAVVAAGGTNANEFTNGFYDGKTQTIHINGTLASQNTIFHEGGHALMDTIFNIAPELRDAFYTDLVRLVRLNPELDKYIQYGENTDPSVSDTESIVEFIADVLKGKIKPGKLQKSTIQKLKKNVEQVIRDLFKAFGMDIGRMTQSSLLAFAENIRIAFQTGKELQGQPAVASDGLISFQQPNVVNQILSNKKLSDNVKIALLESLGYSTAQATTMVTNANNRQKNKRISTRKNARNPQLDIIVEDAAQTYQVRLEERFITFEKNGKMVKERTNKTNVLKSVHRDFYSYKLGVSPSRFDALVMQQHATHLNDINHNLENGEVYFDFKTHFVEFLTKIKDWFQRMFTSSGGLTDVQFVAIENKRGEIQSEGRQIKILANELNKLTKKLNAVDLLSVDKILKGGSLDLLSDAVNADTKRQLGLVLNQMRQKIDGLSRQMAALGLFNDALIETILDNDGKYIHRVYMRDLKKTHYKHDVSQRVWNAAKLEYRNQFADALNDGRVSAENRAEVTRLLNDDAELEIFMEGIINGTRTRVFKTGGIQGSKDTSLIKKRKAVPKVIRDFYGEVTDAELNFVTTVTKLSTYLANHKMLDALQEMGQGDFISKHEKKGWVKVNASNSESLTPLDSPIWVEPNVFKTLEIQAREMPKWVQNSLYVNGLIKSFKTIWSPITQVRNFWSAFFWMGANGHFTNFRGGGIGVNMGKAIKMLALAGKVDPTTKEFTQIQKDWLRLIELQVADQNVTTNELSRDYLKGLDGSTFIQMMERMFGPKAQKASLKGTQFNKLMKKPAEFYSVVDDMFRIASFYSERGRYSDILFGQKFENLTAEQQAEVEVEAANVVKATYPNYSKIYPIVDSIRSFPLMGAFVSFSAEMVRTTINQSIIGGRLLTRGIKEGNQAMIRAGASKVAGMLTVGYLTGVGVEAIAMAYGEFDDEELIDELQDWRPPWAERIIPLKYLGDGKYATFNPATINPYGYFTDVYYAGQNQKRGKGHDNIGATIAGSLVGDEGLEGNAAALGAMTWKFLEPFLGPEITISIIQDEYEKAARESNVDNETEKWTKATLGVLEKFAPGVITQLDRAVTAGMTKAERKADPEGFQKKRAANIQSFSGVRISELNMPLSFKISKGKEILKLKRKARKDFWSQSFKDKSKLVDQYWKSVDLYHEYLDEARKTSDQMLRHGVDPREIFQIYGKGKGNYGPNFDGATFSEGELEYIFHYTDSKPKLTFKGYVEK